jgi:hypothetical protein
VSKIEPFLTLKELSEQSRMTVRELRRAIKQGLPVRKFGREYKVRESDFIKWTEQRLRVG